MIPAYKKYGMNSHNDLIGQLKIECAPLVPCHIKVRRYAVPRGNRL